MVNKSQLLSLSHNFLYCNDCWRGSLSSISTDTRSLQKGDLFIALDGENFKGNKFVDSAILAGAGGIVFHLHENENLDDFSSLKERDDIFIAVVENTLEFLQELASIVVRDWQKGGGKVIGITGSNGKTTHKEILLSLISDLYPEEVMATSGNFNNHVGVPLTIFKIEDKHRFAIIEMGSNHPGEVARLCEIANPDCGIITNIGESHLEFLVDTDGVFKEKSSLYEYVKSKEGVFVVNSDDKYLSELPEYSALKKIGRDGSDYFLRFISSKEIEIKYDNHLLCISNDHLPGRHNFANLGVCLALCLELFKNKENILVSAAEKVVLPKNNRSVWTTWKNNARIFLDAYNANPSSMKAGLTYFCDEISNSGVKIDEALFVLGDMNELGSMARDYHEQIGSDLKNLGAIHVAFIGAYGKYYKMGFGVGAKAFQNVQDFTPFWKEHASSFKWIFLKASRSLQFEELLDIK